MASIFDVLIARLANIFETGGAQPFPINRDIVAYRPVAATGLPGGPTVADLEKYQIEFGRRRFGNDVGGYTYNPVDEQVSGLPYQPGESGELIQELVKEPEYSRSPGFRSGPIMGGYQPNEPRSSGGAAEIPDNINRGGFFTPDTSANQV
jgi:hypothetical protein